MAVRAVVTAAICHPSAATPCRSRWQQARGVLAMAGESE